MEESESTLRQPAPVGSMKATILGSGCSTSVPHLAHVLGGGCSICPAAAADPWSKDRRGNVSLLLRSTLPDGAERCIMVDFGKTARQGILQHFPPRGLQRVHALILTHAHMDAIGGLDDTREIIPAVSVRDESTHYGYRTREGALRVLCDEETYEDVARCFPYILEKTIPWVDHAALPDELRAQLKEAADRGEDTRVSLRWVAVTAWTVHAARWAAYRVCGVLVQAFPVHHGPGTLSLGFAFGPHGSLVYISDINGFPEGVLEWLRSPRRHPFLDSGAAQGPDGDLDGHIRVAEGRPQDTAVDSGTGPGADGEATRIDTLVIDLLSIQAHATHFSAAESVDAVRSLRPRRAVFVGMSCMPGHEGMQRKVLELGADMEGEVELVVGYDGMEMGAFTADCAEHVRSVQEGES